MEYILILILTNSHITTATFNTESACKSAVRKIDAVRNKYSDLKLVCVEKGK